MSEIKKPLSFSLCPLNIAYVKEQVAIQKKTNSRYGVSQWGDDLITHLRTKAKPVKKAKTELVAVTYPIKLNIEAWDKWITFRKVAKFKVYKSDATMKKLSEMGNHGEQMLIVQNSIDCEYQGLFALKANNSAAGKTSGNLSACEDFING
jgi:hypothetical protein